VREVSARRPGGRRLRRARLRKKWLKHCAAVLSVHASIMRHPYDEWSPEEKRRLKPMCRDVLGKRFPGLGGRKQ